MVGTDTGKSKEETTTFLLSWGVGRAISDHKNDEGKEEGEVAKQGKAKKKRKPEWSWLSPGGGAARINL